LTFECWLRQLVEDIGSLVHPAALAAGLRPHFLDRLPEAERAVGGRELGTQREPAPLQVEEELAPGLRTLAHAVELGLRTEFRWKPQTARIAI
jgi:hypothetical protein